VETSNEKVAGLIARLHDPAQLRTILSGCMLLAGYLGIYLPFSAQIVEGQRKLAKEQSQGQTARQIEGLEEQARLFKDRLPTKTDTNEWVQYVLGGVRQFPLKLVSLDPGPSQQVGPYQALVLQIELEGGFPALNDFLEWIAGNERLFRVNAIKLAPARDDNNLLQMQLTVMGLMG
jgi:Tfp pilus assembly protein PilO